jgi:hypothetical protein
MPRVAAAKETGIVQVGAYHAQVEALARKIAGSLENGDF